MMDYENIYCVLVRNERLRFKAMVELGEDSFNHEKVVKFAEKEFQEDYKKALAVVNDPDREMVRVYRDDMEHFMNKYDMEQMEHEALTELIYDFISKSKLSDQFHEFLVKNKGNYNYDIDFLMKDYDN